MTSNQTPTSHPYLLGAIWSSPGGFGHRAFSFR
jgi:hypothetical protein